MLRKIENSSFVELLTSLKKLQILTDYELALYGKQDDEGSLLNVCQCNSNAGNPLSFETLLPFLQNHILEVMKNRRPAIRRLKGGLLCFLVPFHSGGESFCLVGDGVRDKCINIKELEDFCRICGTDVFEVIEKIEALPVKTVENLKLAAAEAQKAVVSYRYEGSHSARVMELRGQVAYLLEKVSRVEEINSFGEAVSVTGEIFRELFRCAKIALVLRDENKEGFHIHGLNGLSAKAGEFPEKKLSSFTDPDLTVKSMKLDRETRELFLLPEIKTATCFALVKKRVILGFIAVFDHEPDRMDIQLAKLSANMLAAKLFAIKVEKEKAVVGSLSHSLMSLANILLFAENNDELYRNILEISADLARASHGSIMLVDGNSKNLRIAFCKGMNWSLARSICVRMGEGIAGKVAESGIPLLVDDVEKDGRVHMVNRPRFKTKALLCVPLKLKEKTIGVLNLSDKENLESFTESDLNLVASFADLASLMIERAWTLERSSMLEKLSVTDYLTGLYNHRFLKSRLEEELSRSARSKANVTVIFIDLDFFKIYNDLCGHLAGDTALKTTAEILKASVRDMDIVVRYGGEEFCIVLPETSKKEASIVAERIRCEIEKEEFQNEENMPFGRLTASFGIATFPEDGINFTSLIHSADLALYSAKTGGRNRVVLGMPVFAGGESPPIVPGTN